MSVGPQQTRDAGYAARLLSLETVWWKRWFDVQAPYRWNLRRLRPGFVLDVGCGLGRNLAHLGGQGVGVDHNPHSVEIARARGFRAFTPDEFERCEFRRPATFDTLLFAHVAEHMSLEQAVDLLAGYLPWVKESGRAILISPQEAGHRSDPTHVEFMDFARLDALALGAGLRPTRRFSFPLPRLFGRVFRHNEFVVVCDKPAGGSDRARLDRRQDSG